MDLANSVRLWSFSVRISVTKSIRSMKYDTYRKIQRNCLLQKSWIEKASFYHSFCNWFWVISWLNQEVHQKLCVHPKYSKHWLYPVAHTIDCVCSKMLNHGLNHRRRKYGRCSPNSVRPISYFGSIGELCVLDLKTKVFSRKEIQLH